MSLPVCLLPDLLELERSLPEDPAAFLAAVLDPKAATIAGSTAAVEVLRFAASEGLSAEALSTALRNGGLGDATVAMFSNYWAMQQPSRGILDRVPPLRLVDMDWSFGVSASSSEHMAMGTTFVQLRLHVQGAGGSQFVYMGKSCHPPSNASPAYLDLICTKLTMFASLNCRVGPRAFLRLSPYVGASQSCARACLIRACNAQPFSLHGS